MILWARYPAGRFPWTIDGREPACPRPIPRRTFCSFPSLFTDTFGLSTSKRLPAASPVAAAFPVRGPIDIIGAARGLACGMAAKSGRSAAPDAISAKRLRGRRADRKACMTAEARHYDWEKCTTPLKEGLAVITDQAGQQ